MNGFTTLNSENYILNEGRIDLWQFSLTEEVTNSEELLNEEEKTRANRFYFERHRRRFINARATVRTILARYLNTEPEELVFSYNPQGKPAVLNSQKLEFNLSHSQELGLLAIGKKFPIGVDLECYSARPYDGIAKHSFSPKEIDALLKVPPTLKPALFFHIWSQKEAFIKATGLGLSYPTQEFSVPTTIPTKQLIEDTLHNTTWLLRSFMPKVACSGALCYNPTIKELRYGLFLSRSSLEF